MPPNCFSLQKLVWGCLWNCNNACTSILSLYNSLLIRKRKTKKRRRLCNYRRLQLLWKWDIHGMYGKLFCLRSKWPRRWLLISYGNGVYWRQLFVKLTKEKVDDGVIRCSDTVDAIEIWNTNKVLGLYLIDLKCLNTPKPCNHAIPCPNDRNHITFFLFSQLPLSECTKGFALFFFFSLRTFHSLTSLIYS